MHFALTDNTKSENASVWEIDHGKLHQELLPPRYKKILKQNNAVSFTIEMFEQMKLTIEEYNEDMNGNSLIFLEPPSIDSRIVNQFSHLALLPDAIDPMDNFLSGLSIENVVYKFIIPEDKIIFFRAQLDKMNIT